jgi:hypothetical protein
MRPVSPGCLAVVVGAERTPLCIGRVVNVVDKVMAGDFHDEKIVVSRFGWSWVATGLRMGRRYSYHAPHHLMRIDDNEAVITEQSTEASE